jgi:hypothetical protein
MEKPIWEIPFGNRTPITDKTVLYLLTSERILERVDNRFYRSVTCEKNTIVVSAMSVFEFNTHNLTLPNDVTVMIFINDSASEFVFDKVRDIEHFIRYLRVAERECCDLSLVENDVALDGMFVNIDRNNEKLWKANKILLTNINLRDFQKMHFAVDPAAAVAAAPAYPNFNLLPANKKYIRNVKFAPIEKSICDSLCDQQTFNRMIEYLVKIELYNLTKRILRTILLSFEYCHMAIKCPYMKDVVVVFPELSTCMIYAMRVLYLEEKTRFGNFTKAPTTSYDDRFIFGLDDVGGLPYYPKYTPNNPYFVEPGMGSTHKQQLTIPAFLAGTRGIYNRKRAMKRLEEFTGGVLANIQWTYKGVRTALCGSAIPAIFIHNVLETYINHSDYFQEYYPAFSAKTDQADEENLEDLRPITQHYVIDSDDDYEEVVASEVDNESDTSEDKTEMDFSLAKLKTAHEHIVEVRKQRAIERTHRRRRRRRFHNSDEAQFLNAKLTYEAEVRAAAEEADEEINMPGIELADVDLTSLEANSASFEKSDENVKMDNELTDQEKIWDKYTDIDLMVETDDFELFDEIANLHFEAVAAIVKATQNLVTPYIKLLYTENKYKYKIYGLPRSIEIFMVNSIPGVISKFHMAPVRAWWDGADLHMLPTFITAAMTSVCYDLRWISCAKDLRDIVLKYFQRGFTQVLNKEESVNITSFLNTNPRWPSWTMPAGWGGWRATAQWANRPIYFENMAIFNPSISKCGVYYKLNIKTKHGIQPLEYNIIISEYSGPNIPKCLTRTPLRKKIRSIAKMPADAAGMYK